jgi:hypothetical protein
MLEEAKILFLLESLECWDFSEARATNVVVKMECVKAEGDSTN